MWPFKSKEERKRLRNQRMERTHRKCLDCKRFLSNDWFEDHVVLEHKIGDRCLRCGTSLIARTKRLEALTAMVVGSIQAQDSYRGTVMTNQDMVTRARELARTIMDEGKSMGLDRFYDE